MHVGMSQRCDQMNVGELIEKLKELNPNLPVYFGVSDTWFWSADCLEVCDPDNFGEDVCLIYHLFNNFI
jgi:hypothetical protein